MEIESEKVLEKKLSKEIEKIGGWSIKLLCTHVAGLPDRLCLIKGGIVFFVEVKTTNKKPRKIQLFIHRKLEQLGFKVYVVDTSEQIQKIIENYA